MKKLIIIIFSLLFLIVLALLFQSKIKEFYLSFLYKSTDQYENISEIVISGEGCYGECEFFDFLIKRNGEVILRNGNFTKNKGLFSSKINSNEFDSLVYYLKKSKILSADKILSISADTYRQSMSLIKNNEITNSYYYCEVNENLVYDSIFIYAKKLKNSLTNLKEISFSKPFLNHAYFSAITKNTSSHEIYNSESFYLLTIIDQFKISEEEVDKAKLNLELDLWSQYADKSDLLLYPREFLFNVPFEFDSTSRLKEYEEELSKYPNYPKLVEYNYPYLKFVLNSNEKKVLVCNNKLELYLSKN